MPTMTGDDLVRQLQWRYATKKFDPSQRIAEPVWNALERSLVLAPSSFGMQPWKFVVVTDATTKAKLPAISWGQEQVRDASHVVVMAGRKNPSVVDVDRLIDRAAGVRGANRESLGGYRSKIAGFIEKPPPGLDLNAWASRQVYLALGMFLAAAAVLGVDACPMEGIDPQAYDGLLELDVTGYTTLCVAAAGYRAADDKYAAQPKVRFEHDEVIRRI